MHSQKSLGENVCDKASFNVQKVSFGTLIATPEGPNSGVLVIQDEEAEEYTCCGKSDKIKDLPFPQNKNLKLTYDDDSFYANLIPVLNQPLSSNHYYIVSKIKFCKDVTKNPHVLSL
ncbi:hypothetical protein SO802_014864 [Lithocarpus litseifolius]|uniref:Uncharacterized protein n=1 Tax=Lithocarpus litseifolius TaxID=425828 RepID=A0AAW2CS66_9ROSI